MLTLTIDERNIKIQAEIHDSLVRGTVGAKCKVIFTDFWSTYNKTIVFKRSSNSLGTPYTIFIDKLEDEITIPWEILTESGAFKVGAYGTTNTEILPTLWSDDIVIKYGSDTAGQAPEPPTPSVYQELIETAKQATEVAQSVRDDADSGKFDGKDGTDGKDGYTPIKGVDYFDGAKGDKGDKGDKGADGDDYVLTESDKIEIADMLKPKEVSFANGATITAEDNTLYYADTEISSLTIIYPNTDFICSFDFTIASEGDVTITLPESKYIGGTPSFANGETWEVNIKNGVVVGGLVE